MENTVIQHTLLKFDQSQKTPDFKSKPQMKQKKNRSSEKTLAVATLIST